LPNLVAEILKNRLRQIIATTIRKLNRALVIYRDLGSLAVIARLGRRLRQRIGRDEPKHSEWLRWKQAADSAFDSTHGTQTGGIQELFGFQIVGQHAQHGLSHIASDPDQFVAMMADLKIDVRGHTFIDLGSGKGRALMLAAALPFRRLIGVEFSAELHQAAKANFAGLAARGSADPRIELVCDDAATYALPPEPLVVYLFNPFGSTVVRKVAERILASWRQSSRPVHILYMNPVHLSDFIQAGWQLSDMQALYAHLTPK
jgi:predicted RNA methylase